MTIFFTVYAFWTIGVFLCEMRDELERSDNHLGWSFTLGFVYALIWPVVYLFAIVRKVEGWLLK